MRLAILRNSCVERSTVFDDGVLEEVARLPFHNVRELKGALNRLSAYAQLGGETVRAADVRAILGERAARSSHGAPSGPVAVLRADGTIAEYDGFLADVLQEVESRVEPWKIRIGEACDHWRAQGYQTGVLERAMTLAQSPDVDGLLTMFARAVEHLRVLESRTTRFDTSQIGNPVFRDPQRIDEAQAAHDAAIAHLGLPAPSLALTRETFEGGSSQLAMKAFDAIVEHPGSRFNPLLVHGTRGSGKTHFVHALGNALIAVHPRLPVACTSARSSVHGLMAATQQGKMDRWRSSFRNADVLILDDIQLLADKERTQDELFHLFNSITERGGQVVVTSDRPAREITGLADRLRSRFEGGLVAALQPREVVVAKPAQSIGSAPKLAPGMLDMAFFDREKVVFTWPDIGARLIEEFR
jgi:chromosomal replication initiation ATPase DnaA